jgi:hypothetical protein
MLVACNADCSVEVPSLVTDKYRSPCCFKNVRKFPTNYDASINSWIPSRMFEA